MNPLHQAVDDGDFDNAVKFLSLVGSFSPDGYTALMSSVRLGSYYMFRLLLPFESQISNDDGVTALSVAAQCDQLDFARYLLPTEGGFLSNDGKTALYHACAHGFAELVSLLLPTEYDLTSVDETPLEQHCATPETRRRVEQYLRYREMDAESVDLLLVTPAEIDPEELAACWRVCAQCSLLCAIPRLIPHCAGTRFHEGATALMLAVVQRQEAAVLALLEAEAGLVDENGDTALMYACTYGLTGICAALAATGKETGLRSTASEATALVTACQHGFVGCVRLLADLEAGVGDCDGMTGLMYAARYGHTDCVRLLAEKEAKLTDECGCTALYHACRSGQAGCARLLLEAGEVPILGADDERTALMTAAEHGHVDCVRLLAAPAVTASADLATASPASGEVADAAAFPGQAGLQLSGTGETASMLAVTEGPPEVRLAVVQLLMSVEAGLVDPTGTTLLMTAAQHDSPDVVALLLTSDTGRGLLRRQDDDGMTALHLAALHLSPRSVHLLPHELGMQTSHGVSALMFAAQEGFEDGVKSLLAEAGLVDEEGQTALHLAAESGHAGCVELLLRGTGSVPEAAGAVSLVETGRFDQAGRTALALAAAGGHLACVELLSPFEAGLCSPADGSTALMAAAAAGHADCARRLLPAEAGMARTTDGASALLLAAAAGHDEVAQLLADAEGAICDSEGRSALHFAAAAGASDLCKLLLSRCLLSGKLSEASASVPAPVQSPLLAAVGAGQVDCATLLLHAPPVWTPAVSELASALAALSGEAQPIDLLISLLLPALYDASVVAGQPLCPSSVPAPLAEAVAALERFRNLDAVAAEALLASCETEASAPTHGVTDKPDTADTARGLNADLCAAYLVAAQCGNVAALHVLADRCALTRYSGEMTALMHAVLLRQTDAVRALLPFEAGAVDAKGRTALLHACHLGHAPSIRLLARLEGHIGRPADVVNSPLGWAPGAAATVARVKPAFHSDATPTDEGDCCAICLCSPRSVAIVPCGHRLCADCVQHVMARNNQCPICRGKIEATVKLH
jgi:ankyrin repeat protein